jgi:hypothetical protein
MTRREFDGQTKENWGGPGMAGDERRGYRLRRGRPMYARWDGDMILRRAATCRSWKWHNLRRAYHRMGMPFLADVEGC